MTERREPKSRMRPPLSGLENEVMQAVWKLGPSAVETVHEAVAQNRDLKETSTRTILRRLEQKGYLRHEEQGRAYIYHAIEPARSLAARAVRNIIDSFCRGSVEELVSGMVEAKVLNKKDLDELEEFVRSRTGKGGK